MPKAPAHRCPSGCRSTNATRASDNKKAGDAPKPIEVAFVAESDHVRMVPVKRGISDDSHVEILEGIDENQDVVSGTYKAINRDLEDGKKVVIGEPPGEAKEK